MQGKLVEDVLPTAREAIVAEFGRSDFLKFLLTQLEAGTIMESAAKRVPPSPDLRSSAQNVDAPVAMPTVLPSNLPGSPDVIEEDDDEDKETQVLTTCSHQLGQLSKGLDRPMPKTVMATWSESDQEVDQLEVPDSIRADPVEAAGACMGSARESEATSSTAMGDGSKKVARFKMVRSLTSPFAGTNSMITKDRSRPRIDGRWTDGREAFKGRQRTASRFGPILSMMKSHDLSAPQMPKAVFADKEDMKQKVRLAMTSYIPNTVDFYKTEGFARQIAANGRFETLTLLVISINAIWIAVDTDMNPEPVLTEAHPVFQIAEHLFCIFFSFEISVRYMAYRRKRDCFRDAWFVFDAALCTLMVFETWIMSLLGLLILSSGSQNMADIPGFQLLRMVRMLRIVRVTRLVRAMPELLILIKGITLAARSVFFTFCLLAVIIYIFAVAFRQLTAESDDPVVELYFRSVPYTMKALFVYAIIPDMAPFLDNIGAMHIALGLLAMFFVILSTITVMNMLIGVLVEVVTVVSAVEKEGLKVTFVKQQLLKMLQDLNFIQLKDEPSAECDFVITRREFEKLLTVPEAAKVMKDVGVDPVSLVDHADFMFKDVKGLDIDLPFGDFIAVMLRLRSTNASTVGDVVDLRKIVMKELLDNKADIKNMAKLLAQYCEELSMFSQTSQRAGNSYAINNASQSLPIGFTRTVA